MRRTLSVCVLALALAACDSQSPTSAFLNPGSGPLSKKVDGSTSTGFFFLPPLARTVPFTGTFQSGLSPVVQIDQIQEPTGTVLRTLVTFTMATGIYQSGQHYGVTWNTHDSGVAQGEVYRIRVLLSGHPLGTVDVVIVGGPADVGGDHGHGHPVNPTLFPLQKNATLPIRFRIESGAGGGGGGGPETGTLTKLSNGSASDQQSQPVISGTNVVWTEAFTLPGGTDTNFDQVYYNLLTGIPANLTNTPTEQEFLSDIDGSKVVWTHTSASDPGSIVVYDLSTALPTTIAGGSATQNFQQPSIGGRYVTFLRNRGGQIDVYLFDLLTGIPLQITNDAAVQGRPRIAGDYVVYEDYSTGNSDVLAYQISTGTTQTIASGPGNQSTPDVSGNTIIWVDSSSGSDQIWAYDVTTGLSQQLTTAVSSKILPRISGARIVWSDDRSGNLDLYLYNLDTHLEQPLVTGPGDQFLADIDGDRVVYTDNASGFEEVYLFTFNP